MGKTNTSVTVKKGVKWLVLMGGFFVLYEQMGESNVSTLTLEPSVSFGKFENDSLSWEKWSSFSPNKYLEEVEKCSTPGSVAEKKAYFEAHYKNIAARKAELEQDNQVQCAPASSKLKHESHVDDTNGNISEFDVRGVEKFSVETEQIFQQKAYLEELYKKIADRMGEQEEQDTPEQYAYPELDELMHKDYTGNMSSCDDELNPLSSCDDELNPCSAEKHNGEMDQIALKKAYFEGRIKEIEGSRAERTELDKPLNSGYPKFDELQNKHHSESGHTSECTTNAHVGKNITKQVEQEVVGIEAKDTTVHDGGEKLEICATEGPSTSTQEAKRDLTMSQPVHTRSIDNGMELVITEEPSCLVSPSNPLKLEEKMENNAKTAPKKETKNLKVKDRNITVKKVSAAKEKPLTGTKKKVVPSAAKSSLVSSRTPKQAPSSHLMAASKAQPLAGTNKILVSSAAKSSPVLTPRPSKLAPASPSISASKLSGKKLNTTYLPRNKNTTPVRENKRAGPTSLHMSLNLGSPNFSVERFEPASARKSLIMEQMADKDIIKRAFSAFKNNFQELRASHDEKSIRVTKASKVLERELTTPPRKVNEGVVSHEENKRGKAFSPSVASKSDGVAEKRKDFLKKVGQKSITREVDKVQIPTRSKGKDGEVTMLKKISKTLELTRSKG
ncbi:hypothetical protein Leryth_019417 [Lithospermum erythrorhizon]|nr:hypothetical protein Leryth_019417 [Lithospermum erythrorhizon]